MKEIHWNAQTSLPITCLLLPHWTLKPNNEWYHSWHSQAHQIHLKAVSGHLASQRGSQRFAPSSDHPQRSQPARQVTALHDTHPSGSFTFTLGTWSPCPCSALYSSTWPFMCLGITIYTLLTSYLLLVLFPQTTFFEAHKLLFNNGSSGQQIFIECLLCALHGARCQEYKELTFCITVPFLTPSLVSLFSQKYRVLSFAHLSSEANLSINWKGSKICVT